MPSVRDASNRPLIGSAEASRSWARQQRPLVSNQTKVSVALNERWMGSTSRPLYFLCHPATTVFSANSWSNADAGPQTKSEEQLVTPIMRPLQRRISKCQLMFVLCQKTPLMIVRRQRSQRQYRGSIAKRQALRTSSVKLSSMKKSRLTGSLDHHTHPVRSGSGVIFVAGGRTRSGPE